VVTLLPQMRESVAGSVPTRHPFDSNRTSKSPAQAGFFVASVETATGLVNAIRAHLCPKTEFAPLKRRVEFVDEAQRVLVVAPDDLLNL